MILGAHSIIYSKDSGADRAFLQEVLGFPSVDAGHGWGWAAHTQWCRRTSPSISQNVYTSMKNTFSPASILALAMSLRTARWLLLPMWPDTPLDRSGRTGRDDSGRSFILSGSRS